MILKPRLKHLDILGLGSSIATPSSGIQAEAIVVHSYDELERRASEVMFMHRSSYELAQIC